MMPSLTTVGGMAAAATVGGLTYFWWRRRQARNTRTARMRAMLMDLGASAGGELPRMIGQAAAQSKSAWLPLAAPADRASGCASAARRASAPARSCSSRSTSKSAASDWPARARTCSTTYRRRMVREVDPNANRGWGWTPWFFGAAAAGGAYWAYKQGWIGGMMPTNGLPGAPSRTMVRDVMTRGVETAAPDTTIAEVARRMRDLDVGSLPVTDGNRLLGIVTDRDLSVRATAASKDPNSTKVREVMSPELAWVFDDEPADAAARVMRERQIRRLPVLDRSDRLVGVVALADLATDLGDDKLKGATLEEISQPSGASHR